AACATVDTLFIRNVCSRDPVEFHRWFRELDRWDRTQVLSDSGYCQAIYNRIERKVAELESRENSSRTRFNQIWNPENVSCDPSRQSMEFTLQNNLLPAPSNSSAPSSQQYYRYIIEKHCPPDVELSACSNRISVETWSRNISRPIRPTQQIVLRHGQRMSLTSWSGGDRRLTPGIQRIENTTIAEDDPKLQRLIQESVDLCSRLYSPELYEFDDGETSTTTTD
ncbi:MAG: hypothetical protein HRT44_09280, partial [Bdellovibrionales bacterium]|nr:hypothetical protein [Bdellovibrionales bacterium]NQZ19431.1 hypothetical protein [Bdellovibrionales bacterium]